MKKIIIALLFCISCAFSANLHIQAYHGDKLMMEYHYDNVKNWKWQTDQQGHKYIRIEFYGNNWLDLPLNDYEVKIIK